MWMRDNFCSSPFDDFYHANEEDREKKKANASRSELMMNAETTYEGWTRTGGRDTPADLVYYTFSSSIHSIRQKPRITLCKFVLEFERLSRRKAEEEKNRPLSNFRFKLRTYSLINNSTTFVDLSVRISYFSQRQSG